MGKMVYLFLIFAFFLVSCDRNSQMIINAPLEKPSHPYPADKSVNNPVHVILTWELKDASGITLFYDVFFGEKFPPPVVATRITARNYDPGELSYETKYYWRIVAKNEKGEIAKGPVWTFTTEEKPPSTPSNPDPTDGSTDISINQTLSWNSTDTDELIFYVYLSESSPPSLVASTTKNRYNPKTLEYETTYYWQIVADDKRGKQTKGPIWTFTTEEKPPSTPSSPNPPDNSTDVSINQTLSWESTDTDELLFIVLLDESSPPSNSTETTHPYIKPNLKYETTYYWEVIADDKRGKIATSPIWTFTTEEMPPSTPSRPSPHDGENNVSTDVMLSWDSTDTDELIFSVYLSESSPPSIIGTAATNEYMAKNLRYETTYYWRVIADDKRGKVTKGPIWKFTTEEKPNRKPQKPVALYPKDKSYGVPVNITLLWMATDLDNDNLTYDLYFGKEKEPPIVKVGMKKREYRIKRLHYSARYYWRVVVKDGRGGVTEGDTWSFKTMAKPNSAPSLPYDPNPSDGEVGISTDITLRWEAYDSDGDALRYDIYLGENENPALVESNRAEKFYKPSNLESCTTYYWKVDVKDSRGARSYGDIWKFKTAEGVSPDINWEKTHGGSSDDIANKVRVVKDGYIVVGSVNNSSDSGGKVILISKDGEILKEKIFGGSSDDVITDVREIDGGYILVGYTKSEEVEGYHGGSDFWILKIDRDFNLLWQKAFGGSSDDRARSVLISNDGIVVAGYTESSNYDVEENNGNSDGWIVKLDFDGDIVWKKSYGGSDNEYINDIELAQNGDYVVVGTAYHSGSYDLWILEINPSDGTLIRQGFFGGDSYDEGHSLVVDEDGDYVIAGHTRPDSIRKSEFWVVKIGEISGGFSLEKQGIFGGNSDDKAYGIAKSCDGKFIVVGKTYSSDGDVSGKKGGYDVWVIRVVETYDGFDLDYEKTFGGVNDDVANSVTVGNGYIVAGYTQSSDGDVSENSGGKDFWILDLK